jgi:hypothetical protein
LPWSSANDEQPVDERRRDDEGERVRSHREEEPHRDCIDIQTGSVEVRDPFQGRLRGLAGLGGAPVTAAAGLV